MVFRDHTYSVLIVSASEKFVSSTSALLPPSYYYPVTSVSSSSEARRSVLEISYDIVIINAPLSDEFGTALAMDICGSCDSGVLLFVKADMYDAVYDKVFEAGVMVMSKPISSQIFSQSLHMMCSARERLRNMQAKQATVEDKIREIRLINKAKWCLIESLNMSEEQAHHYIEKQAMDMRIPKLKVAESIIKTYS